jgi:hypothetical protein
MAKLNSGTRVYGSFQTDAAIISPAGAGFMNLVAFTSGTSVSYSLPSALQYAGAKFKVTIIGAGGSGGGTAITAGQMGGGGGSGAVVIAYITVVASVYTLTYTVAGTTAAGAAGAAGNAGSASSVIYNSVTYSAGGGLGGTLATSVLAGGAGGTPSPSAFGTTNVMGLTGYPGHAGGVQAATTNVAGIGANTPLGWGQGGVMPETAAGQAGQPGTGYGSGGSGARNGTGAATTRAGGTGAPGLIIIEY